jgi:hypothetical protein
MEPKCSIEDDEAGAGLAQAAIPGASQPASASFLKNPIREMEQRMGQLVGQPDRTRLPKLTDSQLELTCLLASEGLDAEGIAQMMGIDRVGAVKRVLKTKAGRIKIAQLKGEVMREELLHRHELARMLPKGRKVLNEAMDTGNTKERSQVAQWLHEAVVTKPAQKHEHRIEAKIEHDLTPLFQQMGEHLAVLRQATQKRDVLDRVKLATEQDVRALSSGDE